MYVLFDSAFKDFLIHLSVWKTVGSNRFDALQSPISVRIVGVDYIFGSRTIRSKPEKLLFIHSVIHCTDDFSKDRPWQMNI